VCCMYLSSAYVAAQGEGGNHDYYRAKDSPETERALRTVESYHIGPGVDHMNKKEWAPALADFEFILNQFPNHPRALALVSELCDLKWKVPRCDATQWLDKAVERNPSAPQTYVVYGIHFHRQGKLAQAIDSYKRAIALRPDFANAHYDLGLAYIDAKDFDLANQHAQISYSLGMPLPGLRDKLTRAGKWKPLDPAELNSLIGEESRDATATPK
jgi:tetratricopeptide (TPR) repeat protein